MTLVPSGTKGIERVSVNTLQSYFQTKLSRLAIVSQVKSVNGILCNWESLCDIRPDCNHHFEASGTSNAMFDKLAERPLMTPLTGTKHSYARLAIAKFSHFFQNSVNSEIPTSSPLILLTLH